MKTQLCLVWAFVALARITQGQMAVVDDFNRANSTNLGPDWVEVSPDAKIENNQFKGNSPFAVGWAAHTGYAAPYFNTVVRVSWSMTNFGGDAITLIAGADTNTWSAIETKIQDNNGDGLADRVFFNAAVNAGTWFGGSLFFNLATPTVNGVATLYFTNSGDTANLDIENPTSGLTEHFSANGILTNPPLGTSVGLGFFGDPVADDFTAWTGVPTGPVYAINPPRVGASATYRLSGAVPNGMAILALSTTGTGPLPTPLGFVSLSLPIGILATLPTDAQGVATLPTGMIPATLAGLTVHNQALDTTAPALSNPFSVTIQ